MEPNQNPNINQSPQPSAENPAGLEEKVVAPGAPEVAAAAPSNPPTSAPPQLPASPQPPAAPVVAPAGSTTPAAPQPLAAPPIAEDVDVIEKEWVDQAEKIVGQTKEDPYAQEEAVEDLQVDYLKKRYGHTIKKPGKK